MRIEERKKLVNQVMVVMDELVEEYLIHRQPLIKKSDNVQTGWNSPSKRKTTVNWTFQMEKPTRKEVEMKVRQVVEMMAEL